MSVTLHGGPRDGETLELPDGAKYVHLPVLDDSGMRTAIYDVKTGALIRETEPVPHPVYPAWAGDTMSGPARGRIARIRRALGLRIAGLTEGDIDDGSAW